ncbi:MAG: hypothetical protein QM765_08345 [Myxococcales bacterium]
MVKIGFSTARGNPASLIIRALTGSKASHAWLLVRVDPFGQDFVFEASEYGVRLVPWGQFRRQNRIVAVFEPQVSLEPAMQKAGELLGAYYDFKGLVGMAFVILGRWLRRKWRNPLNTAKAMWCSELVAKVLKWAHHPGVEDLAPTRTSPQDLLDLLRGLNAKDITEQEIRRKLAA